MHPAAEFIVSYFGSSSSNPIYLASLPNADAASAEPGERHIITRNSEQIAAFVTKWNRPGRGVYFAVSPIERTATRRAEATVAELVGLHVDIDFKSVVETPDEIERIIGELPLPPTKLNHTGHGLHGFWGFRESDAATPENKTGLKRLLRLLADHLGGDLAVCEVARLMRLPGTTNSKNGDALEVRTLADRPARYDPAELARWLENATPVIHRKDEPAGKAGNGASLDNPFLVFAKAFGAGEAPIDVEAMLADMQWLGPGCGGNVHDTLLRCSAAMLTRGETVDTVIAKLLAAWTAASERSGVGLDPVRAAREIREMCESWIAKHPEILEAEEPDVEAAKNPLADFHFDGTGSIEPELRLIDDLLSTTGLTLIGGQSGAGKTFLAIMMAVCLAEQKPFFEREVRERVGTLYVAGEGQGGIAARIAAAKNAAGVELDRQLPIAWLDTAPSLDAPHKVNAFVTKLRALSDRFRQDHGVRLGAVIFDTASACFDLKDENDNAEVTRICKIMQRVGAGFGGAVIPLHHYGKVLEAGPRGASAWRGHTEIIIGALADVDPLTGDVNSRELAITKNRDGTQGPVAPFALELVILGVRKDGREFGACFVKPDIGGETRFGKARKRKAARSETALHDAVVATLDDAGANKTFQGSVVRAVHAEGVRIEFNRRYAVTEEDPLKAARAKRVAFNRALAKLPAEFGMGEFEGIQWIWRV